MLRKSLRDALTKIYDLLSREENSNDDYTFVPNPDAVAQAKGLIVNLFQISEDLGLHWIEPSITASPEGEVLFEWWCEKKKLTIYVGGQTIDYVQVWGTDIHAKITDGDLESTSDCCSLWIWLTS
jgi:hypothetical protein